MLFVKMTLALSGTGMRFCPPCKDPVHPFHSSVGSQSYLSLLLASLNDHADCITENFVLLRFQLQCILIVRGCRFSSHRSSSVSFCSPLWVTLNRSSSNWRTRSVASVSLFLTSSLSSERPCEERSSSYKTERRIWITITGVTVKSETCKKCMINETKDSMLYVIVLDTSNAWDISHLCISFNVVSIKILIYVYN